MAHFLLFRKRLPVILFEISYHIIPEKAIISSDYNRPFLAPVEYAAATKREDCIVILHFPPRLYIYIFSEVITWHILRRRQTLRIT